MLACLACIMRENTKGVFKMTIFQVKTDYIKAASIFTEKAGSSRYYLAGINVEFFDRYCTLVSTEGHRLFVAHNDFINDEIVPDWIVGKSFILPIDAIKKAMVGNKTIWTTIKIEQNAATIDIGDVVTTPIDGKYPYWRNILKVEPSGQPSQLNGVYMADFAKAAKILGNRTGFFSIHHNGLDACPISFQDENCAGLVMPIKLPKVESYDDNYKTVFGRAFIGVNSDKLAAE